MLEKFFDLFRKSKSTTSKEKITSDQIRKYAKVTYITPARQQGKKRVTFSSADIHQGMKLHSSYPMICSAIDAKKFQEFAKAKLETRSGPKQGAAARWTFRVE